MKKRKDSDSLGFDSLRLGLLTWVGLALAVLGWTGLLGGTVAFDSLAANSLHKLPPNARADLIDVAKCVIVSGFGLAIIGALQAGFGTLNRFFGAVLMRSANRESESPRPATVSPDRSGPMPRAPGKKRPYRILIDGSVEVDTILGTRVFKTMDEAREFI